MNEKKEKLTERLKNMQQKLIPDTIKAIDQLYSDLSEVNIDIEVINEGLYLSLPPGQIRIDMPYNITFYRVFRRMLSNHWYATRRYFNEYMGAYWIRFGHREFQGVVLEIALKLKLEELSEGQSCKLVVDHYKEPEPVYKVVCK